MLWTSRLYEDSSRYLDFGKSESGTGELFLPLDRTAKALGTGFLFLLISHWLPDRVGTNGVATEGPQIHYML